MSHGEEEIEEASSENGIQQFGEIVIEPYTEEDPSALHLELEESQEDALSAAEREEEIGQYVDQEIQGVPELEAPPPPVVSNIPTSAPILSTLRVKEPSQMMVHGYNVTLNYYFI